VFCFFFICLTMQVKKSLEDLEKIYAPKKNLHNKPDLHYETLKVSRDEFNTKPPQTIQSKAAETDFGYYDQPKIKKDDFIEIRTFLPAATEKMISSRYENPLTQLKSSTKRWKIFTLILVILSFTYFSLNLWATLVLSNIDVLPIQPRAIIQVSDIVIRMQDMQFYSYTMNIVMDVWAIIIYITLFIKILRENSTKVETMMNEKGLMQRIMLRFLMLTVVLFGISYLLGTVFALVMIRNQINARHMTSLIIFHSSKMVYLLLNVIAVVKYNARKFVYEDLLLEALGSSGSVDEQSESDDHSHHHHHHYLNNIFGSDA